MDSTKRYYNLHSQEHFDATVTANVTELYTRFLKYLPPNANILDVGCGSGRDSKAFVDMGYKVSAIDASSEMCALASKYTGINVICMDCRSIHETQKYDAVWACASLLHIDSENLLQVLARLREALRTGGIIYMSFKYGDFEGERDERYFLDMNEEKLSRLVSEIDGLRVIET